MNDLMILNLTQSSEKTSRSTL